MDSGSVNLPKNTYRHYLKITNKRDTYSIVINFQMNPPYANFLKMIRKMVVCISKSRQTKGEEAQTDREKVTSSSFLLFPTHLCIAILRSIGLQL